MPDPDPVDAERRGYTGGLPLEPVDRLLERENALIARIFRTAGVAPEVFRARCEPVIRNLAAHVHLLPATESDYLCRSGGLFHLCLEIGLHALEGAHAAVFPAVGRVEQRYTMLPRWALATLLAGFCAELYRPITHLAVLDHRDRRWSPLLMPLYEWARAGGTQHYFVRWLTPRQGTGEQAIAAFLASRIIPPPVLQYLDQDNHEILPAMIAAIAGAQACAAENPIARIVASVTPRVIEENRRKYAGRNGRSGVGVDLEPRVTDAGPEDAAQHPRSGAAAGVDPPMSAGGAGKGISAATPASNTMPTNEPKVVRSGRQQPKHTSFADACTPTAADKVFSMLSADAQRIVREIVANVEGHIEQGDVLSLPQGVGLSGALLAAHAKSNVDLLQEFAARNWLWLDKTHPIRKLHAIEIDGRTHRLVIMKPEIARALGFRCSPPAGD